MELDIDHAAAIGPLLLGIMAAVVTVYVPNPNGRIRHLWTMGFLAVGLLSSLFVWRAVSSSQRGQNDVLVSVAGANAYAVVFARGSKDNSGRTFILDMQNITSFPMFDIKADVSKVTVLANYVKYDPQYRFSIESLPATDRRTIMAIHDFGMYAIGYDTRNGSFYEALEIKEDASPEGYRVSVTLSRHYPYPAELYSYTFPPIVQPGAPDPSDLRGVWMSL